MAKSKGAAHESPLALIQARVGLVNSVSGEWDAQETPLWWHPGLGVFSASRDLTSFWGLTSPLGRLRRSASLMRAGLRVGDTALGPFYTGICLPSDAVIIGAHRPRGPVIVSASQGRVLKWVSKRPHLPDQFRNEISALQMGARIAGGVHVPELYAYGTYEEEADWMFTGYVPNSRPFISPQKSMPWRLSWIPWLKREGLDFMWKFYHAAGLDYVSAESLLGHSMLEKLSSIKEDGVFVRERDRAGALGHMPIIRSLIHGDFSGHHVHRHKSGFTVIDWGESRVDYVFKDIVGLYWRNPDSRRAGAVRFWEWLSGKTAHMPIDVEAFLLFQERRLGVTISPPDFRVQLRLVMLDEIAAGLISQACGEMVPKWRQDLDEVRLRILSDRQSL